jgi:hypothetical protein
VFYLWRVFQSLNQRLLWLFDFYDKGDEVIVEFFDSDFEGDIELSGYLGEDARFLLTEMNFCLEHDY